MKYFILNIATMNILAILIGDGTCRDTRGNRGSEPSILAASLGVAIVCVLSAAPCNATGGVRPSLFDSVWLRVPDWNATDLVTIALVHRRGLVTRSVRFSERPHLPDDPRDAEILRIGRDRTHYSRVPLERYEKLCARLRDLGAMRLPSGGADSKSWLLEAGPGPGSPTRADFETVVLRLGKAQHAFRCTGDAKVEGSGSNDAPQWLVVAAILGEFLDDVYLDIARVRSDARCARDAARDTREPQLNVLRQARRRHR